MAEIDARVAANDKLQAAAREAKLASQGIMDGWIGSDEAGDFITSGNTDNKSVTIGVTVVKETRT